MQITTTSWEGETGGILPLSVSKWGTFWAPGRWNQLYSRGVRTSSKTRSEALAPNLALSCQGKRGLTPRTPQTRCQRKKECDDRYQQWFNDDRSSHQGCQRTSNKIVIYFAFVTAPDVE